MKLFFLIPLIFSLVLCCDANKLFKYLFLAKSEIENILAKSVVNTQCAEDVRKLLHDVIFGKHWALKMLDASAKIQPGIITGNFYHTGNYDECLEIATPYNESVIKGQYCTVVLVPSQKITSEYSFIFDSKSFTNWAIENNKHSFHINEILTLIKFTFGICVPSSCSIGNLQSIWDYVEHTFKVSVHVVFNDVMCSVKDEPVKPHYSIDQYVFAFFGIVILIVFLSTIYDYFIHQNIEKKKCDNIYMVFSLYTNTIRLFDFKPDSVSYLKSLNGIKVISMIWVVLGHRVLVNVFRGNLNGAYVFEWKQKTENMVFLASSLSVDSFLFLSGLLLTYTYLHNCVNKKMKITVLQLYFLRILRLSPALIATVLFYISILKHLADGPYWSALMYKFSGSCYTQWFSTLFFLTNFITPDRQCLDQSWFMAVDTQLFVLSPIVLLGLIYKPFRTIVISTIAIVISMVYVFIVTVKYNLGAMYFEGNWAYHYYIYQPTYVRMPAYIIGIFVGYIIFKYPSLKVPKWINVALWIGSLSTMVLILWFHLQFTRNEYDSLRSAVYNTFVRPMWAICLGYISLSCISGQGGVIDKFLSARIYIFFVKLAYSIYLTHLGVLFVIIGRKRAFYHFSNFESFHDFFGDLVLVLVSSVILYLTFEAPFINIAYMLRNRNVTQKAIKEKENNQDRIFNNLFSVNNLTKNKKKVIEVKTKMN